MVQLTRSAVQPHPVRLPDSHGRDSSVQFAYLSDTKARLREQLTAVGEELKAERNVCRQLHDQLVSCRRGTQG